MEWILIIWLQASYGREDVAIEHIPGFVTEKQCEKAGEVYKKRGIDRVRKDFVCVERGGNGLGKIITGTQ